MFDLKQYGLDQNISLSMGNLSLCHLRCCATIYVNCYVTTSFAIFDILFASSYSV